MVSPYMSIVKSTITQPLHRLPVLIRTLKRIHTPSPLTDPSRQASLPFRSDVPAEKPGSQPHDGSIYAILKVLELTLEALKKKT